MSGNLVEVILRLRDEASRALRQVAQAAEEARAATEATRESLNRAADASAALAQGLLGASAALAGFGVAAVRAYGEMEQARIGFGALLGSAERAEAFLRSLYDFAATTPFEIQGLQDQARRLMALGFSAEQVIPLLRILGDAVAAMGGSAEVLDRVVLAIAQIQAKGRVQAEEMLQLAEAGIPAWEMLAQKIGVSVPEAMKMAEKGAIDAATAISALVEGLDQRFAGAMEAQSRTILGTWSNIKDTLYLTLADIGEALDEAFHIREGMQQVLEWLQRFRQMVEDGAIQRNLQEIGQSLSLVAGALAGALTPGLIRAAFAVARFVARLSPWALAGTAVVAVLDSMGVSLEDLARSALDFGGRVVRSFGAIRDAVVAALTIALEKILAFFSSFRAAPAYAEGLFLALTAPIRGFVKQIESAAEAARRFFSGDWAGALEAARMALPWNALGGAIEDAKRRFAEGTTIIRERWSEARSTIAVLEDDLANAMLRISQAWSGSGQAARRSADEAKTAAEEARRAADTFARGQERAKAGAESTAQATKSLTDAVDALRKRYELGDLTLAQYLQSLRGLLGGWEAHLQGLKAGTDEWKRYANAVLAARKAIEDATTAASRMARAEQERRAPRDWSGVMTGPEVVGVEGWQTAILDAVRLEQFDRIGALIANIQERLAQGGLSEPARKALEDTLRELEQTYADLERRITRAVEEEGEARLAAAQAESEERVRQAEEAAQALIATERAYAEAAIAQLRLITQAQKDLEESVDLGAGLKGLQDSWERTRAMFALGLVDEATLREEARFILDALEGLLAEGAESLDVPVLQAIQRLRDELVKALAEARVEVDAKTMEYARSLVGERDMSRVSDIVGDNVRAVEGLAAILQANLRTGTISASEGLSLLREALDATEERLKELYTSGQITAEQFLQGTQALERYEGLARQLAEAAAASVPALQDLRDVVEEEESFIPAEDYYAVAEGAAAYLQELQELNRQVESGAISLEEYQTRVAELRDALEGILPVWEAYIAAQEAAGVSMEDAREALERLRKFLAQVGEQVQRLESQRLSRWASDLASDISRAANAVFGLLDAFSAPSFGQGLGMFARGLSGIMSFIPGLNVFAPLVDVVGGVLGRIVDGILGVFDSGWGRVQEAISKVASRFKLISREAFQSAVETYQESYLFGLIRVTKYRINEALMESLQAIAGALEGGVLSGVRNAAKAFLRGAADWAEQLRQGIREAIANAVIEAVIQGAVIKGALGKLLDELTAVLAEGDYAGARAVAERIMAAIPAVQAGLENVLAPFRGFLGGGDNVAVGGTQAIRYELPTVTMASPSWVSEMGSHVAEFGAWVRELTERGVRVRVEREFWSVLAAAIGG